MTKKEIGKIIRQAREKKKYTYYRLAKITGADPGQLISIETASRSYTIDLLLTVAKALDVSVIALGE